MIMIKEVFPANTHEELPPHQIVFIKRTKQAKTDFKTMLDKETEKIDEVQRIQRRI